MLLCARLTQMFYTYIYTIRPKFLASFLHMMGEAIFNINFSILTFFYNILINYSFLVLMDFLKCQLFSFVYWTLNFNNGPLWLFGDSNNPYFIKLILMGNTRVCFLGRRIFKQHILFSLWITVLFLNERRSACPFI